MNGMEIQEAIKDAIDILKRMRIAFVNSTVDKKRVFEPIGIAIEALEKQVPKKPINKPSQPSECSVCGERIFFRDRSPFCSNCGQKLDWSE